MLFNREKIGVYQYMDEMFCCNKKEFDSLINNSTANNNRFWSKQDAYSLKSVFPSAYQGAKRLIFGSFLPLYSDNKPTLMDLGCANGEWTLMVASNCNCIDGYDYSQKMIDKANQVAKRGRLSENLT